MRVNCLRLLNSVRLPLNIQDNFRQCLQINLMSNNKAILGLQPIPADPKDNGVAAMLDDRTFCFVIQHGRHAIVFLDFQGLVANQEYNT